MADLPELRVDLEELPPRDAERLLEVVATDAFVAYASNILLEPTPTPADLEAWHRLAVRPGGRGHLVARMLRSSEIAQRSGARWRRTVPLGAFIRHTYMDVLGRAPDESGMQTYMRIGAKWRGRSRVFDAIAKSAEGQQTQGGKLERVAGLKRLARRSRFFLIPVLGRMLDQRHQRGLRVRKMELMLAALLSDFGQRDDARLLGQIRKGLPELGWDFDAAGPQTALADDASKSEIDTWVFEHALLNARRDMATRTGLRG